MLEVKNLNAYYGKSHTIHSISFDVSEGEVIGILGRNGVGKTTLMRSILGLTPPRRTGLIKLGDIDLSNLPAHRIAKGGLGYVPQGRRIFPRLTVLENLILPVTQGRVETSRFDEVFEYFPVLKDRAKQLGSTLSGGEQQMLAIGRAIMSRPRLIIIDEPTEGLQPSMVLTVRESIKTLCKRGITAIIAEQNLENALDLCDRVYVLEKGAIRYQEQRENLSMALLHQYLGVSTGDRCEPVL
ncbi:MAG: ABC transporter ATP-binding protein [Desulfobacterales bacterium]|jgi:branched-chain amino acid transport system ATP-binding protein